jgi:hypothetical protein
VIFEIHFQRGVEGKLEWLVWFFTHVCGPPERLHCPQARVNIDDANDSEIRRWSSK